MGAGTVLKNVQALRAIAALAVALSHLVSYSPAIAVLGFGTIGVELFFVISGFIMVYITNDAAPRPLAFFRHRVVRVVPLYWLLTLAVFALAAIAPQLPKSSHAEPLDLVRSLLFIPYVKHGSTLQPLLFQGWTLNFEMVFYLLFAGSLVLRRQVHRVLMVSVIIALAALAGQIAGPLPPVVGFYTSPLILCFALGMGLGLAYPRIGSGLPVISLLSFGVLQCAAMAGLLGPEAASFVRISFAFAVVAVALALEQRGKVWDWPPIQLLGAASYSLYLAHPFAAIGIEKLARTFGLLDGPLVLAALAAAIAAMIAAGLALYRLVELPLQRAGRRLLG
ncbi:MAG: acyltransferase [Novosphingobium sp.]|uniref:acyltransferase family protein n=1 Tax=Novosphingobium sp. TaxID=1874826 RepID=UPI0032BDA46B